MKKRIIEVFSEVGIREVGFCAFSEVCDSLIACRALSRIPENAQTVILALFPYKVKNEKPHKISRYAAVCDYHPVVLDYLKAVIERLKRLFPNNSFQSFCDNSPIPEVMAAAKAGLGKMGENGLRISENWGSFVFIGEIVTDLKIETENLFSKCSGCGKCKTACPKITDCLSAVTQKKGELSEIEIALLRQNGLLWGCDICAEVCPENKSAQITYIPEFLSSYRQGYILGENPENRPYNWRGEGGIRRNYNYLSRNVQKKE